MNPFRRTILRTLAAGASLAAVAKPAGAMAQGSVTGSTRPAPGNALPPWTAASFSVRGVSRYLVAGTIDYFRCPPALWRDRILKAKRAGLNTITTCVAWNQHERTEGHFDFSGRADLPQFLRVCSELGMLAFVRFGPFICDEFEAGGYPAWLIAKPGTEFRVRSAVTDPYIARWFAELCHRLAPLQVSRGGALVLVEAENEYFFSGRPGGLGYVDFLVKLLRVNAITVPIVGVESGSASVLAAGTLPTLHGFDPAAQRRFRSAHPELPLMIAEQYTDWMDCWGWDATEYPDPLMLEQQSFDALSQQIMLSYFCFHGGTSFGFLGSSTWKSDHSWVTNRYYGDGPVAEGGALNPTYFAVKNANQLAANFEDFFATAKPGSSPLKFAGPVISRSLVAARGLLIAVVPQQPITQSFHDEIRDGKVSNSIIDRRPTNEIAEQPGRVELPDGRMVELAAGSARSLMLPYAFRIDEGLLIDFSNATLLGAGGMAERRTLVFWGEPGRRAVISINGSVLEFIFPLDTVHHSTLAGLTVLGVPESLLARTWFAEDWVVIGADYVGATAAHTAECLFGDAECTLLAVAPNGEVHNRSIPAASGPEAALASLSWQRQSLAEPSSTLGWQPLPQPRSAEQLGIPFGYLWYRAKCTAAGTASSGLLFTAAADRVHVWVDAEYRGVWGRGTRINREMIDLECHVGATLTFLSDNMGRSSEGGAHQSKGIWGPAFVGARRVQLPASVVNAGQAPAVESWQFKLYRLISAPGNYYEARWSIPCGADEGLQIALRDLPVYAWIYVDEALVAEHRGEASLLDGYSSTEYLLKPDSRTRTVEVLVRVYCPEFVDLNRNFRATAYSTSGELYDWAYRPWQVTDGAGSSAVISSEPCLWRASAPRPPLMDPLFFATQGLGKGQLFVNGEPTGRYWDTAGPHHSIYLPDLKANNEFVLFDEDGRAPDQTYLFRDSRVPTRTIVL